jgi:hypothetical protein
MAFSRNSTFHFVVDPRCISSPTLLHRPETLYEFNSLFSERNLVELLRSHPLKLFVDPAILRSVGLNLLIINVLHRKIQLILIILPIPVESRTPRSSKSSREESHRTHR